MAAITILGAAAAALQLAEYGKGIVLFIAKLYKNVKSIPQHYREYEAQLNFLVQIAEKIAGSEQLQSIYVQIYLESLEVEVRALQRILCQPFPSHWKSSSPKRLWTLIAGAEQREIDDHLDRLDKKNTQLSLYIQIVNSDQIATVHSNLEKLNKGVAMAYSQSNRATSVREAKPAKKISAQKPWESFNPYQKQISDDKQLVLARGRDGMTSAQNATPSQSFLANTGDATFFADIEIDGDAIVYNGDVNECSCTTPCSCADNAVGSIYASIVARDGIVLNGPTGKQRGARYGKIRGKERAAMCNGTFRDGRAREGMIGELIRMVGARDGGRGKIYER
ncbi:hypothetical protein GLAREA_04958 [Glarea lozoyensis ATCC 20868]|uniref:Fungal N-terminal domain-containing protein n=1 Tax=Glarea lozoyensis (strain ATCC 20868 / MF5171) TaxID=1116229 RepID=S3CNS4_GLAL2|nr:uncharacterized protein GLAREA_04958 [Glarea lozoyensis ATCC 20868]EPE28167.1 hypothetical protein GLAREA_04958 [Glarea lozoyensis ATCC 20868]